MLFRSIAITAGATSGYAFARYGIGGKSLPFWILSLKFFPPVVAIVPYFLMMRTLRLIDTQTAVIITHLIITVPFAVWMIKGFIQEIPRELEEAAMIDGCTRMGTIWKIIVPLSLPALATIFIYAFMIAWNEYLFASVFLKSYKELYTLPLGLKSLFVSKNAIWDRIMAASVCTAIPVVAMFMLVQKNLVGGLTSGGVKE